MNKEHLTANVYAAMNPLAFATGVTGEKPFATHSRGLIRWIPVVVFGLSFPTFAQTKLKLSAIKPGTERVQLINNGDFQFQGPLTGTNYPFPTGWSSSVDLNANAGTNMVPVDSGVVARAQVNSSATTTGF